MTKTTATVRLVRRVEPVPEPRVAIALAVAVLKGDKMDDVVRDAVMLGVSEIVPFVTERTEIGVGAIARSKRVDRWQRVAIASAKQCGRAVVPRIRAAMSFADWMAQPAGAAVIILVEPGAAVMTVPARRVMTPRQVVIAIGPEGGWTDAELDAAIRAGAAPVTLGTLTLRADAAPAVALAVFRTLWEDF